MRRLLLLRGLGRSVRADHHGFAIRSRRQRREEKTPLYYQDPDGKPDYSPAPKKTADGRDYVAVYDDQGAPPAAAAPPSKPAGQGRILYYRNPMGLPDTSPVPKKDSMGMDYIPVYESEAGARHCHASRPAGCSCSACARHRSKSARRRAHRAGHGHARFR